jgi:hypothetical protein
MKNLIKFSFVLFVVLAFASCGKTEFENISPAAGGNVDNVNVAKIHEGDADGDTGELFTDKNKCKKCHSSAKAMGIDWKAPYMSDGRYANIEELINNFDFVNNVHYKTAAVKDVQAVISEDQKQALIAYLKSMAAEASQASVK